MITMNNTLPTSFPTKAAQKQALDSISRQYEAIRREVSHAIWQKRPEDTRPETHRHIHIADEKAWIAEHGDLPKSIKYFGTSIIFPETEEQKKHNDFYYAVPNSVHHIREKHRKIWAYAGSEFDFNIVLGLAVARDHIKSLPIYKAPKVERTEGKRTERSATHRGCCQLCGKAHKVDVKTGLIAEHGYTVQWGWQNGSCAGSHHLPIEKSKVLVEKVVFDVAKKADEVRAEVGREHNKYWAIKRTLNFLNETIANWKPRELTPIKYDN
jgi:hypothetical protein